MTTQAKGRPTVPRLAVALALCALLSGAAAADVQAAADLSKAGYIAKGDAICRTASAQLRKLPPTTTMASVVAKGPRWLSIDRRALKSLRALSPPAADRARISALLALADKSINKGIAGFIAAAKRGNAAGWVSAGRRAQTMINAAHRAARAYGFGACARW